MSDKSKAFASAELGSELRGESPGEFVRSFAGLIDDRETLQLLNYYDSLFDVPVEDTEIGQQIIQNAATETIDDAVRHGGISQMKAATGLTGHESDGGEFYSDAASRLENEGSIGLVFGAPGSGKTAATIDIARSWKIRTGGYIIGNTSWNGFDGHFSSDKEMQEEMASRKGPVLAIVDEVAQELSGFGSGNKAAEAFSNSMLFIRKREEEYGEYAKRGSALLVGHTRTKTAKAIRRIASFAVEKPHRNRQDKARILDSEVDRDEWEEDQNYTGLTDTSADYPEREPSEFDIIEHYDDEGDDENEVDADDVARNQHIKTAILAVEVSDMTYAEASDLVPFSQDWVGDRYREWKNENAHSELVDIEKNQDTEDSD